MGILHISVPGIFALGLLSNSSFILGLEVSGTISAEKTCMPYRNASVTKLIKFVALMVIDRSTAANTHASNAKVKIRHKMTNIVHPIRFRTLLFPTPPANTTTAVTSIVVGGFKNMNTTM